MSWLAASVGALVAGLSIPLLIGLAQRLGAIDNPNTDVVTHTRSVPLFGGVAIIAGTLSAWGFVPAWRIPLPALLGMSLLCLMGLYKDISRRDLSPWLQLTVQMLFCGLVLLSMVPTDIVAVWLLLLWLLAGVALINAINFLDVSDGLCATVAITLCMGMYLAGASVASLFLAGGLVGFLAWNRPRAQIFMGDVGSFFIAAWLYIVLLDGLVGRGGFWGIWFVLAVPFGELAATMLVRRARARSIMQGDASHLSLLLLNNGMSPWVLLACFGSVSLMCTIITVVFLL
jgi:UDP-GlcNAc:undecaprenyl-phosphate GlcNAc-1-phosphate transferase